MNEVHPSPIVRLTCRKMARLIQIFAIYVIMHGHYSPGGGFQGGALLAASIFLLRIGEGGKAGDRDLPDRLTLAVGSIGALIFAGVGALSLFNGGDFLAYSALPIPGMGEADRHYWGILVIEIGVGLAVMAVLVTIFDRLMERSPDE
ncbi:MAG: MnhB domain-containing protein [Verrucomicrobiota bacterium]